MISNQAISIISIEINLVDEYYDALDRVHPVFIMCRITKFQDNVESNSTCSIFRLLSAERALLPH